MVIDLVDETRAELVRRRRESTAGFWFDALDAVKDPEIPVLSIWDLGVLQNVEALRPGELEVTITPTYSGCPAMDAIKADIEEVLLNAGAVTVRITTQLIPAWSTDWMDAKAREKLRQYGIASPDSVGCPRCGSARTQLVSEFGSTSCKALYRCNDCAEPFEYFKPL